MFLSRCCLSIQHRKNIIDQTPLNSHLSFIRTGLDALIVPQGKSLIIADYGSSHDRNTIQLMKFVCDYLRIRKKLRQTPFVIHNDLPNNDWTHLFQLLMEDSSYLGVASGRSFFDQCLPMKNLSFGYSSASLHHLSRIPCSIRDHCYIDYADPDEQKFFQTQAQLDWEQFLRCRSNELHSGGILVLSIPCRYEKEENGFDHYFDLLYRCAKTSTLFTEEELIDFTLPFYLRSFDECIDEEFFARYSFECLKAELICLKSWIFDQYRREMISRETLAQSITLLLQPGVTTTLESILQTHGKPIEQIKEICEQFWFKVEKMICHEPYFHIDQTCATNLILKKK